MQDLWTKTHAAIRAKPEKQKAAEKKPVRIEVQKRPNLIQKDSKGRQWLRAKKTSSSAKKQRIAAIIAKVKASFK